MKKKFIPDKDDEFTPYFLNFVTKAAANPTAYGFTTQYISDLEAAHVRWGYDKPAFDTVEFAYHEATETKDETRQEAEVLIREGAGIAQAKKTVTDAQKEALGITVRKTTRTAAPIPSTVPSVQRIDTSTRGILRIFIVDATTPETRAKPDGVASCEIREQIGGTEPTHPLSMALLAIETRMPYRADFDPEDVGKPVYFAFRWINTRGKPGPWSQVYSSIVPG